MIIYDSMQFNVFFKPMPDIRKHSFKFEEDLKEYFPLSFNILPIPDNAPFEVPRIIGASPNQHSNIQISANMIQLSVLFDKEFSNDENKCYAYTKIRIERLLKVLENLSCEILFMGLITQCVENGVDKPRDFIRKTFFNLKTSNELFDVATKATFVSDEQYYVNIELTNLRNDKGGESLGIVLDVNNRYIMNFGKNNKDENPLEKILLLHSRILKEKINDFISKGELSI